MENWNINQRCGTKRTLVSAHGQYRLAPERVEEIIQRRAVGANERDTCTTQEGKSENSSETNARAANYR